MIAKLTGLIDAVDAEAVTVDVGGVGYAVLCSSRTLAVLPPPGGPVSLMIETHVREDHIHLYGFAETAERDWFRLLLAVQGVGARLALHILSVLTPAELGEAIAVEDAHRLTRANGVGAKLARRIAGELKDKVAFDPGRGLASATAQRSLPGTTSGDAISALVNLGYRRTEALGAVAAAQRDLGQDTGVEALITGSLRELTR